MGNVMPGGWQYITASNLSLHSGRLAFAVRGLAQTITGDMNDDGLLNTNDIVPFSEALVDPATFAAAHPNVPLLRGDGNCDGALDGKDVSAFVESLLSP